MRLAYVLNQRFPTEKAYGVQVAKMCEAFARAGAQVTLFIPTRPSVFDPDPFSYYGVWGFTIQRVHAPDWYWPGVADRLAFFLKSFISARKLMAAVRAFHPDLIYTRDVSVARFADVFEAHKLTPQRVPVVAISHALKSALVSAGMKPSDILVAPDGVSPEQFHIVPSIDDCRRQYALPLGVPIIGYVGQLRTMGMEKGIDTLLQAFSTLASRAFLLIVGGAPDDITYYRHQARALGIPDDRIRFVGRVLPTEVPFYLQACDILAMPFPNLEHYARFMSPLKLFEYMASGKPIVASDLPTIREVLDETTALLVPPSDHGALASAIETVMKNPDHAAQLGAHAREAAKRYSWDNRARQILSFIQK